MKKYQRFITTGCSFTAGVTEDPVSNHTAFVWPHFCMLELQPETFRNFALSGGGNTAALENLILYFELNPAAAENCLVGMNLTALGRVNYMCEPDNPNACQDLTNQHIVDELDVGWMIASRRNDRITLDRGLRAVTIQHCLHIVQGITYLEARGIDYFFMLMNRPIYLLAPEWFQQFLMKRNSNWVQFDGEMGMMEFCQMRNLVRNSQDHHPSVIGHRVIADHVMKHLQQHAKT